MWVGQIEELLDRPAPLNPPDIQATRRPSYRCHSTNDRRNQDDHQKNQVWKTTGPDNIPAEALKPDIKVTANTVHTLSMKSWEEEQVPMD
ncbi:unnamed protein product [Schistosoma curassoni]|uniref:Uncharacterized protein n=1 Tax=Schistosoma curassoni TaxID=6186 RepID=A0A183KBE1_9TREM|nr:unnamed protein product [Schistosoma curassoni]